MNLFDNQKDLFSSEAADDLDKDAEVEAKRERLLEKVRGHKLDTREAKVAYVLSQYPETRNSDITLQLQYWHVFQRSLLAGGMVELNALYELERLTDLTRARQKIQNTLRLFMATDERVARHRKQLDEAYRRHHAPADVVVPSIFVYGDESGKNEANLIVGSVWMLATGEYHRLRQETKAWKEAEGISYELHSADLGKSRLEAYRAFIQRFIIDDGTLGFKAVSLPSAGIGDEQAALADLFYFLLRRGVEHEASTGRAPLPRHLMFTKDAEEAGADERVLAHVDAQLQRDVRTVFERELYYDFDPPASSKGEVLLQIADLFTWSVNRRLNVIPKRAGELAWKDAFAEWFLEAVQFEMDDEAVYNDRAVRLSLQSPTLKKATTDVVHVPDEELDRYGELDAERDDEEGAAAP